MDKSIYKFTLSAKTYLYNNEWSQARMNNFNYRSVIGLTKFLKIHAPKAAIKISPLCLIQCIFQTLPY